MDSSGASERPACKKTDEARADGLAGFCRTMAPRESAIGQSLRSAIGKKKKKNPDASPASGAFSMCNEEQDGQQ